LPVVKYPFNNINIVIFLSTSTIKSLLVDPFMFHIHAEWNFGPMSSQFRLYHGVAEIATKQPTKYSVALLYLVRTQYK